MKVTFPTAGLKVFEKQRKIQFHAGFNPSNYGSGASQDITKTKIITGLPNKFTAIK